MHGNIYCKGKILKCPSVNSKSNSLIEKVNRNELKNIFLWIELNHVQQNKFYSLEI